MSNAVVSLHKLIDLSLLTKYTNEAIVPIANNGLDLRSRVQVLEGSSQEISYTLLAEDWDADEQTNSALEELYPSDTYDIDIFLDDENATSVERDAFVDAVIYGGSDNVVHSAMEVPTVDIPIKLKVVSRYGASSS